MPTDVAGAESMTPSHFAKSEVDSNDKSFIPQIAARWVLVAAACTMLVSGSFDSIASKWQNKRMVWRCADHTNPDCSEKYFEAPFWQSFTMYLGEALCLLLYYADEWITRSQGKPRTFDFPTSAESMNKPMSNVFWWIIPTALDFVGSTMINYAIVITFASTVQMLRNFNLVLTALLTIFYLRRALRVHHWVGTVVATAGMVITGVYSILHTDGGTNYDSSKSWIGIVLAIVGTSFSAIQFVAEEALLRRRFMPPFKAVGWEGLWGILIGGIGLIVVQFAKFEDVKGSLYQMGQDRILLVANVLFVLSITIFNSSGLIVTKLGSGLMRAIMFASRSVTIWIIELIIGWNKFNGMNFAGLLVLTLGVLLYNHVYPGSWCKGFDRMMTKEISCCGIAKTSEELLNEANDEEKALGAESNHSDDETSSDSSVDRSNAEVSA